MFSFPSKVYLRTNVYILFINKKRGCVKMNDTSSDYEYTNVMPPFQDASSL